MKTDCDRLPLMGYLAPLDKPSESNWTLGCETLDRDFTNYFAYCDYLLPLGIKRLRLQGGWAKTEKEPGVYDFTWLDNIIDDARGKGFDILLETDYGNAIYEGGGGTDLSGGFPVSETALAAWDRWVERMAERYRGKVRDWAMWNEPNNVTSRTPESIAEFNIRTAAIIKRIIPDARILALSLGALKPEFVDACMKTFVDRGQLDLFAQVIYHQYDYNPDDSYRKVEGTVEAVHRYSQRITLFQGENGCPSEETYEFALNRHLWNETSQAAWDMRRMLGDLNHGVESAVFTICDFHHKGRGINRKGLLLSADDGQSVIRPKLAYHAVRNLVSVFQPVLQKAPDAEEGAVVFPLRAGNSCTAYTHRETGDKLIVFWDGNEIPRNERDFTNSRIAVSGAPIGEPVWCDLMTGEARLIPPERVKTCEGLQIFSDVPFTDSPCLIAERRMLRLRPTPLTPCK